MIVDPRIYPARLLDEQLDQASPELLRQRPVRVLRGGRFEMLDLATKPAFQAVLDCGDAE